MQQKRLFLLLIWLLVSTIGKPQTVNFTYSWIGNTFSGPGVNGQGGEWCPGYIHEIEVAPDGTILVSGHSEGGNEITIWNKDGRQETNVFPHGTDGCWGWGTDNMGLAFDSKYIYVASKCGTFYKYNRVSPYSIAKSWTFTGNLDAVATRNDKLFLGWDNGKIEIRNTSDFSLVKTFNAGANAKDIAIDSLDYLWIIAGTTIKKYDQVGNYQGISITDIVDPTAVSIDNTGKLVVCEDGPKKQVLFYNVSGTPVLDHTFGAEGGVYSGTAGEMQPQKLFNLVGAATDKDGNLYVACSKQEAVLRKFDTNGNQLWQIYSNTYIDNFTVDPASDGKYIYGVDEIFEMDYLKDPGKDSKFMALTYNPVKYPTDKRNFGGAHTFGSIMKEYPCFGWIRNLNGRKLQFMQGQYAGDIEVYAFTEDYISHKTITIPSKGWANYVDSRGNVWASGANNTIVMNRFTGFDSNGNPVYSLNDKIYNAPPQITNDVVQRVRFYTEQETGVPGGVMYVSGYTAANPLVDWGCVGSIICRFDGWESGNQSNPTWILDVPKDGENHFAKELDVAGDYLFLTPTRPTKGHEQYIWIYKVTDKSFVGDMYSPNGAGWTDMPNSISAFKRSNGMYVVCLEEDWRMKVNYYRWCPSGDCYACDSVPVTKVTIDNTPILISGAQIVTLSATLTPSNACRGFMWKSANDSIVTVAGNTVKGIKPGTTKLYVETIDGMLKDSTDITVDEIPITSIKITTDTLHMDSQASALLKFIVEPSDASYQADIKWISDNKTIATVDSMGKVTGIAPGQANIIAISDQFNLSDTCIVIVQARSRKPFGGSARQIPGKIEAEDFDTGGEGLAYHDNEEANNGGKYRPAEGVDIEVCSDAGAGYDVGWTNAGEWLDYYVNVEQGIYDVAARVTSPNNNTSCSILMNDTIIGVFSIPSTGGWQNWVDVNKFDVPLTNGDMQTLKLKMNTANFNINYLNFVKSIPVESFSLSADTVKLNIKGTYTFSVTVLPANTSRAGVNWVSGNTNLFTVNNGNITAKSLVGQAYLYSRSIDGIHSDSCLVQVVNYTGIGSAVSNEIRVFPNPIHGDKVTISGLSGKTIIEIRNMSGELLFKKSYNVSGDLELNKLELSSGSYLVSIENKGIRTIKKLVVE